jgi:hypothetical protein
LKIFPIKFLRTSTNKLVYPVEFMARGSIIVNYEWMRIKIRYNWLNLSAPKRELRIFNFRMNLNY